MYLFGGQAPKAIATIEVYDFRLQEWLKCEDMPNKRCRTGYNKKKNQNKNNSSKLKI